MALRGVPRQRWRMMFDQVMARIASRFSRVEPRASARTYLLGLLSKAERKNCRQLAEQAGHLRPGPMQRLLRYARWDADAVACDHRITTRAGTFRTDALVEKLPARTWQKLSAGAGAKGHRFYDWALADIADDRPGHHHLLANTRSDAGRPCTAGSPSRCSPTPSSPSSAPTNTHAIRGRTGCSRSPATRSSTCSSRSSSGLSTARPTGSAGPTGGAVTRPDPRPATTSDKPLEHEDRDLQLEY